MPAYNYLTTASRMLALPEGDALPKALRDCLVEVNQALMPYASSLSDESNAPLVAALVVLWKRTQKTTTSYQRTRVRT